MTSACKQAVPAAAAGPRKAGRPVECLQRNCREIASLMLGGIMYAPRWSSQGGLDKGQT